MLVIFIMMSVMLWIRLKSLEQVGLDFVNRFVLFGYLFVSVFSWVSIDFEYMG